MIVNLTLNTSSKTFRYIFIVSLLVFSFVLFAVASYSWTGPSSSPPNSNVSAPINVGATSQVKNGALSVNGLSVYGSQSISGNLGVGSGPSSYWRVYAPGGQYGVYGESTDGQAIRGASTAGGYAGYFIGGGGGGGVFAQNSSGYYGFLGYPGSAWSFYGNGNTYSSGYNRADGGFCIGASCITSWPTAATTQWHTTDSTWIRANDNKGVYTGGVMQADNGFVGSSSGGYGGYFTGYGGAFARNTSGYYAYLGYPGTAWSFYGNGNTYTAGYGRADGGFCIGSSCITSWPAAVTTQWHTTDSTWIRANSNKGVYTGGVMQADNGHQGYSSGSYAGYFSGYGGVYAQNSGGYYAFLGYPGSNWSVYGNGPTYTASYSRADGGFCIGGSCITSWPSSATLGSSYWTSWVSTTSGVGIASSCAAGYIMTGIETQSFPTQTGPGGEQGYTSANYLAQRILCTRLGS